MAKFNIGEMCKAIRTARGMIQTAARLINCAPNTIYNYAKKHPEVQAAIDNEREMNLDRAELTLMRKVDEGEGWAVCFYLKCQGKQRGYIERQQIEHSGEMTQKLYSTEAPVDEV